MTMKDLIAGRFMRALSLQTIIESSLDYCSNMGNYDGWGFTIGAQTYDRYGEKDKDLYQIEVKKIERVNNLSEIKPDMTTWDNKIQILTHYTDKRLDFVAIFHHGLHLSFGFLTEEACERLYSDYADLPPNLYQFEKNTVANYGEWFAIESGNGYIAERVAMTIALMIEFKIDVDSAVNMIDQSAAIK